MNAPPTAILPLRYRTPDAWAAHAFRDPLALLADHAYLERKAASNALELINRWPHTADPGPWVKTLAAIARDETTHLHAVSQLLAARSAQLPRTHRNAYATALHALVRRGRGPHELLDRLLVSALIEARSCERFEILARVVPEHELAEFYRNLCQSEYSHFSVFVQLAGLFVEPAELELRWHAMLDAEAAIIQAQIAGPRIHSGL